MKHLIIIGARGWGREIYAAVRNTKAYQDQEYDVKGFLDDKTDALDGLKGDFPPILGSVESYEVQPDDVFFCAMGDSQWRKHYAEMISSKGGRFISVINPTVSGYERFTPFEKGTKYVFTFKVEDGNYVFVSSEPVA